MDIPLVDLNGAYRELREELDDAVAHVMQSGWYVGGPTVEEFEQNYARYCEAKFCVGVASGLDALHLALRALDIGPGDEVIVSSNSFIATLLAISMVGATPVLVEPDPHTHNIDPDAIEAAITPNTRALLPTHLYGQPCDLDPLLKLAKRHGLKLVEDGAQAHGARYKGKRIGGHGDVVTWSFYPTKNLGAMGDGGAVTTNDPEIARRIRTLGNYGSTVRYVNEVRGTNSRLDPIQATVLRVKLDHLDEWNDRRRRIAAYYMEALAKTDLQLPLVPQWSEPVWHLFVVRSPDRSALQAACASSGVQTLIHYPIPPHLQQAYADLGFGRGDFPICETLADEVLSLPIGPHLTMEEAERVTACVRSVTG